MNAEQTAVVEISVMNTGTKTLFIEAGNRPVFSRRASDEETPGLMLYTEAEREVATIDKDGCWMVNVPVDEIPEPYTLELTPNQEERLRLEVLGDAAYIDETCPAPGDYRYTQRYRVSEDPSIIMDTPIQTWGFTLTLTEPHND